METELTGDEMYNFVQNKCKKYYDKELSKKKKERGTLFLSSTPLEDITWGLEEYRKTGASEKQVAELLKEFNFTPESYEIAIKNKRNDHVYWYKNGDKKKDNKYVGEIENVKPNGLGKLTSPMGEELYLGMYKEGKQTIGYGYYNWQGNKYFGELKNGIPHGYGVLIWMGEKIFGEFRNMKIWKGTTYSKSGKVFAKYVNGRMELQ